jgi:hypothetical protein
MDGGFTGPSLDRGSGCNGCGCFTMPPGPEVSIKDRAQNLNGTGGVDTVLDIPVRGFTGRIGCALGSNEPAVSISSLVVCLSEPTLRSRAQSGGAGRA